VPAIGLSAAVGKASRQGSLEHRAIGELESVHRKRPDCEMGAMEYRVELEVFSGPLDLLLFLVRKHELDIFDIPIAEIADQYVRYLESMRAVDMDVAGEFLVMASTLMEIKSRMLLPREESGEGGEEEDPRAELVRQLLEYKRFRDAAAQLQELAEQHQRRFPRMASSVDGPPADPASEPIRDVELWDLVSAFGRLMRQTLATAASTIVYDDVPIEQCMERILERVGRERRVAFTALFEDTPTRAAVVGMFLGMLELIRQHKIRVEQPELFGEIWIVPNELQRVAAEA